MNKLSMALLIMTGILAMFLSACVAIGRDAEQDWTSRTFVEALKAINDLGTLDELTDRNGFDCHGLPH